MTNDKSNTISQKKKPMLLRYLQTSVGLTSASYLGVGLYEAFTDKKLSIIVNEFVDNTQDVMTHLDDTHPVEVKIGIGLITAVLGIGLHHFTKPHKPS